MATKGQKFKTFTNEERTEIVSKYMSGKYSYAILAKEYKTNKYVENTNPCVFCKRFILNAGIKEVIVRMDKDNYKIINTKDYIENDESLQGVFGY